MLFSPTHCLVVWRESCRLFPFSSGVKGIQYQVSLLCCILLYFYIYLHSNLILICSSHLTINSLRVGTRSMFCKPLCSQHLPLECLACISVKWTLIELYKSLSLTFWKASTSINSISRVQWKTQITCYTQVPQAIGSQKCQLILCNPNILSHKIYDKVESHGFVLYR